MRFLVCWFVFFSFQDLIHYMPLTFCSLVFKYVSVGFSGLRCQFVLKERGGMAKAYFEIKNQTSHHLEVSLNRGSSRSMLQGSARS